MPMTPDSKSAIIMFATPKKKPVVSPPSKINTPAPMAMPEGDMGSMDMSKCCDKCGQDNAGSCCDQCDQCDNCSTESENNPQDTTEDTSEGETPTYPSKMDLIAKLISAIGGSEDD